MRSVALFSVLRIAYFKLILHDPVLTLRDNFQKIVFGSGFEKAAISSRYIVLGIRRWPCTLCTEKKVQSGHLKEHLMSAKHGLDEAEAVMIVDEVRASNGNVTQPATVEDDQPRTPHVASLRSKHYS